MLHILGSITQPNAADASSPFNFIWHQSLMVQYVNRHGLRHSAGPDKINAIFLYGLV